MIAQSMVKLKGRVAVVNGGCDGIGLSRRGARGWRAPSIGQGTDGRVGPLVRYGGDVASSGLREQNFWPQTR
ncbi:hypothetical protein BH24ACT15_BH24ACT15_33270 [soil metagenome]